MDSPQPRPVSRNRSSSRKRQSSSLEQANFELQQEVARLKNRVAQLESQAPSTKEKEVATTMPEISLLRWLDQSNSEVFNALTALLPICLPITHPPCFFLFAVAAFSAIAALVLFSSPCPHFSVFYSPHLSCIVALNSLRPHTLVQVHIAPDLVPRSTHLVKVAALLTLITAITRLVTACNPTI